MRKCFYVFGVTVVGFLVTGMAGTAAPRPNNNNAYQAYMQALQNYYRQMQQYQSTLARMYQNPRANANAARANAAMMNAYARAYANAMNAQNTAANGFTDYVCVPIEDVTVRRYRLPAKDPADPKAKYTTEELKELKGDPKLIGYAAKYEDLQIGQTVRVTLCRQRVDPKDPEKVTYITLNTLTGKVQRMDENSSMKQVVVRVRGAQQPQRQNNNMNNNNVTEVPADPNKFATMIVIYSDDTPGNPLAGNN
jgi:hypothetical protein